MVDTFILLTPILLLGVIALLGFVGCNQVFGLDNTVLLLPVKIGAITPDTGATAGGTQVTIAGTGFQANATVTFDGLDATNLVIGIDGAAIICNTPAHPSGYVDVTVTNTDGNSDTLTNGFKYAAVTQ